MHVYVLSHCLTLCDPIGCSLPSSSVHGVLQVRILGWVAISSTRVPSSPRGRTHVSCVFCNAGRFFAAESLGKPLSSQIWDQTRILCVGRGSLNHWTTGEDPSQRHFKPTVLKMLRGLKETMNNKTLKNEKKSMNKI